MLIKGKSVQFWFTCVAQKWFVYVISAVRRDHKQRIEMHRSEIDSLKGIFPGRSSEFAATVILFSEWFIVRAKSMSQLAKSWIFLIRVI